MDQLTATIAHRTAHVIAQRFTLENERMAKMDRLTEKLKAAGAVVGRQTAKIEARADSLIAREADIEAKTDRAFSPHEAILTDAERGLEAVERQLALLSNDPLESSGSSPAVERAATFQAGADPTLPGVREG